MAFLLVQQNSGTANGTSITVNYGSAPTNGNLLVAVIGSNDGTATNPTGWSTAVDKVNTTDDDFVRISYKVAGAGETSAVAFTGLVGNNHCLGIFEFAIPTGTPLDVTSSAGVSLAATSQTSGTTAATAQDDELSIVGFQVRADISAISLSNGFTLQHDLLNAVEVLTGYKIESAIGTKESTASWTTAGNSIGVIATFKPVNFSGRAIGSNAFHPGLSPGLGGISSARFQPSNWWPYPYAAPASFDPAFMLAMEKHGNDIIVLPPQVVASGMTPPEEMPT